MLIPADVPCELHTTFEKNYNAITKHSNNLFLFAVDHKLEHLNPLAPEKIFSLAENKNIGALATHLGLIARYGAQYKDIKYIVKLNGKSNLTKNKDQVSTQLWRVEDVVALQKNSDLSLCGVGYTVYLGNEHESAMLEQAAHIVFQAHQKGLVAVLWMYIRGSAVKDERDAEIIAGAAGVGASLGADFVKVKFPDTTDNQELMTALKKIIASAGNTRVIFSGGERTEPELFLKQVALTIEAGAAGAAVGRNIYQQVAPVDNEMINKISALVYKK